MDALAKVDALIALVDPLIGDVTVNGSLSGVVASVFHERLAAIRATLVLDDAAYLTVRVLKDFNDEEHIGFMYVRKDALSATPDFVFTLGYRLNDDGTYALFAVAPILDSNYAAYLEANKS